jgi:TPR repeat protein
MKADSMLFGIGQKADKQASIPLYEESAQNGSSKALLALAAIYEPTDSTKAFFYYDKAAENEPYALFKLGQFMENGLYEEGFRGKPNAGFAFAYYKKATQQEVSCPEALFKLGEYY